MPKASASLPPRLSRKHFSPLSPPTEQDADVLLRFKHANQSRMSPATFDAALAMCQLQATLDIMRRGDISDRPSKRRMFTVVPTTGSIISTIATSSYPLSTSSSPSSVFAVEPPTLPRVNSHRYRMIEPAYVSARVTVPARLSKDTEGTPVLVVPKIPTIKISLKSLERLRKSLHREPAAYRVIDPNYGSRKRKRD